MIRGVNQAYRQLLTRRALSHPLSSSGCLTKARSLAELERARVPCDWCELPEDRREQIRGAVIEVIEISERLQSFDGNRAASIAIRLLGIVDGDPIETDELDLSGPPVPIWLNVQLSEDDRLRWLGVMLVSDMEDTAHRAFGWSHRAMGGKRHEWFVGQAAAVMGSEDPLEAGEGWLRSPPAPPV